MATTTATLTLSSDIADYGLSIRNRTTLTNAGNDTGMTKTTGLTRVTLASTSPVVLIDAGATTRLNTISRGLDPSDATSTDLEYIIFYE